MFQLVIALFFMLSNKELRKDSIEALFAQYDKNQKLGMYSQPIPSQDLPKGVTVFRSIMAPKVKQLGIDLWELVLRHCADGSKQKKGIDYDYSYSPTASATSVKSTLAVAAAKNGIVIRRSCQQFCHRYHILPFAVLVRIILAARRG